MEMIKNILAQLKNVKSDDETIDEQTKTFLNIIESLMNKFIISYTSLLS